MYPPADQPIPPPKILLMPQIGQATSREDDWTGVTDPAARRRAQTRLYTRAYLRSSGHQPDAENNSPTLQENDVVKQRPVSIVPASRVQQLYNKKKPLLPHRSRGGQSNLVFPLCQDHLITLLQFNALRALAVNRTLISGILTTALDCGADEEIMHVVPYPATPHLLLAPLLPTAIQHTVLHSIYF
ncbi:hypothetical protein F4778DRAFT_796538 [Xylariomycetidae sp. FL2044]|nr:hypothetical protein F4778DRAFT_796538 [Xylariomycetidae sp. FL2044]